MLPAVEVARGARLADYRYRGAPRDRDATRARRRGGWLRSNFARNDLFFGYDAALANGVLHPGGNARWARHAARLAPKAR